MLWVALCTQAQTDTIYRMNGEIILANITEIEESTIKYSYPNEDFTNSISKSSVYKIHFKSGRREEFSSSLNLSNVNNCFDWEKVQISNIESDVVGMFRIDDVNVKAQGGSRLGKIESRAYNKLKIQTAMLGGSICYIIDKYTKAGSSMTGEGSKITISGVAYTSKKIFQKDISYGDYYVNNVAELPANSYDITSAFSKIKSIEISENIIYTENNFLKINSEFISDIEEYTIISASPTELVLVGIYTSEKGKERYYNIFLTKK